MYLLILINIIMMKIKINLFVFFNNIIRNNNIILNIIIYIFYILYILIFKFKLY